MMSRAFERVGDVEHWIKGDEGKGGCGNRCGAERRIVDVLYHRDGSLESSASTSARSPNKRLSSLQHRSRVYLCMHLLLQKHTLPLAGALTILRIARPSKGRKEMQVSLLS